MPRNASGTYTLPLPPVISDTIIESVWANTSLDDLAQALTDSLDRYGRGAMVAPLRYVDGTVGAPGFAWQAETGTGLYRESAGVMSVAVQGTKRGAWSATGFTVNGVVALESTSGLQGYVLGNNADNGVTLAGLGARSVFFGTDGVERMRIDAVGKVLTVLNGVAPTFTANGQMTFSLSSNTQLQVAVRGSDGVTRAAIITLT